MTNWRTLLTLITVITLPAFAQDAKDTQPEASPAPAMTTPQEKDLLPAPILPSTHAAPPTAASNAPKMDQLIQDEGGKIETDKTKVASPALELLHAKQESQTAAPEEEGHHHADEHTHELEKLIQRGIPDQDDRGTRKEKRFFKEHKLELEIDRLSKEELLKPPLEEDEDHSHKGPKGKE